MSEFEVGGAISSPLVLLCKFEGTGKWRHEEIRLFECSDQSQRKEHAVAADEAAHEGGGNENVTCKRDMHNGRASASAGERGAGVTYCPPWREQEENSY